MKDRAAGRKGGAAGAQVIGIDASPAMVAAARARGVTRPTPLPTGMRGWLETFAGRFFDALPPADRAEAMDETIALLLPALCDAHGRWTADYVRLRFAAVLDA